MSGWGDLTAFAGAAKSALLTAQKKIDKALEIEDDENDGDNNAATVDGDEFFNSFGVGLPSVEEEESGEEPTEQGDGSTYEAAAEKAVSQQQADDTFSAWLNKANTQTTRLTASLFAGSSRTATPSDEAIESQPQTAAEDDMTTSVLSMPKSVSQASFEPVDLLAPSATSPVSDDSWQHHELSSSFTHIETRMSQLDAAITTSDASDWQDLTVSTSSAGWSQPQLSSVPSQSTVVIVNEGEAMEAAVGELLDELLDAVSMLSPSISSSATNISPPGSDHSDQPYSVVSGQLPSAITVHRPAPSISNSSAMSAAAVSPSDDLNSDIELVTTPTCDTMSERSSISGVLVSTSKRTCIASSRTEEQPDAKRASRTADVNSPATDQRMFQLAQVLESRELKLIELSRENMRLSEDNERLQARLNGGQTTQPASDSKALQLLQQKFANVSQERDQLRRRVAEFTTELDSSKKTATQLQKIIAEKDEQITECMHEGDRLSKQELKHNNIIKKLRAKERENESQMDNLKKRLEEIDALKRKLKEKDAQEVQYDEAMHQLKSTNYKHEKRIQHLEQELQDVNTKNTSLGNNLESAYKQMSELQREKATQEADLKQLREEASSSREAELRNKVEELTAKHKSDADAYCRQIEQLQQSNDEFESERSRREQSFKWEIQQLNKKLEDADLRNQELSEGITAATQPLLRQIENLQASFNMQQSNWERLEQSLYDRLTDADRKLAESTEKERRLVQQLMDVKRDRDRLAAAAASDNQDLSKLRDKLAAAEAATQQVSALRAKFHSELESERELHRKALDDLQKEKELLSVQCDFERNQAVVAVNEECDQLRKQLQLKESTLNSLREQLLAAQFSESKGGRPVAGSSPLGKQSPDPSLTRGGEGGLSWSLGGSVVEQLRERVQQRDAELSMCRDELRSVSAARDNACTQLGHMRAQVDALDNQLQDAKQHLNTYNELNEQHQALLQMYGEKVEENDELRLDLQDIKLLMKQQFESMVSEPSGERESK